MSKKYLYSSMLSFVIINCCGPVKPASVCIKRKIITSVGACDGYGYCGVGYNDLTFGVKIFPVVGQSVCTNYAEVPHE